MKPLLPSLREKKRYLVFEVISKKKLSGIPEKDIEEFMLRLHGEIGLGKAGLIFLKNKWNKIKQRGIVKVHYKYVDQLRAALCSFHKGDVIMRSIGVSGILKKAENKYLG
ncbi:hypothetical protein KY313_00915 [Candidatus Woesearchaeota archaeon]|jgi:ribonuclease P/MRP protein subunit POP5|nr:hypothetical protein [Candidatus Woesearchaeota archaeon]